MIYLDNHATTPCDPRVLNAMLPYFDQSFANPASSTHLAGQEASLAVDRARDQVAKLIGAYQEEIIFTGGATESNNLAIRGLSKDAGGARRRIVTTPLEHKSVLLPCKQLEKQGYEVIELSVDRDGLVDLGSARELITDDTLLVSVQGANNEIGSVQPLSEIAAIAHDFEALVHCDAAQAVGKIPVNVLDWDVDLLSFSSHKFYGPKGVGALYVRGGPYAVPIDPIMLGGGQERELRPGTLNVPGIIGLGEACRLSSLNLLDEGKRIAQLRDKLESLILDSVGNARINGALHQRLAGNSSLTFPGIDAEALIINNPDLAISTGSACTSGAPEPSHVLLAIGLSREDAYSTIRIGLGRFNTEDEVEEASELIIKTVARLRQIQAEVAD